VTHEGPKLFAGAFVFWQANELAAGTIRLFFASSMADDDGWEDGTVRYRFTVEKDGKILATVETEMHHPDDFARAAAEAFHKARITQDDSDNLFDGHLRFEKI